MEDITFYILILLAGILALFLGLIPIISRKYFNEVYKNLWKSEQNPMSKEDAYLYSRYIRQITPLAVGVMLIIYALYKLFWS